MCFRNLTGVASGVSECSQVCVPEDSVFKSTALTVVNFLLSDPALSYRNRKLLRDVFLKKRRNPPVLVPIAPLKGRGLLPLPPWRAGRGYSLAGAGGPGGWKLRLVAVQKTAIWCFPGSGEVPAVAAEVIRAHAGEQEGTTWVVTRGECLAFG